MAKVSPERLKELIKYCPDSGELRWIKARNNKTKANSICGGQKGEYLALEVDGFGLMAHRVAWAIFHGSWPEMDIDHIDGDKRNNRISNLRDVNKCTNLGNQRRPQKGNKTGYLGVSKRRGKYSAIIGKNGKNFHLGDFSTPEKAYDAYKKAKIEMHGIDLNDAEFIASLDRLAAKVEEMA